MVKLKWNIRAEWHENCTENTMRRAWIVSKLCENISNNSLFSEYYTGLYLPRTALFSILACLKRHDTHRAYRGALNKLWVLKFNFKSCRSPPRKYFSENVPNLRGKPRRNRFGNCTEQTGGKLPEPTGKSRAGNKRGIYRLISRQGARNTTIRNCTG